MPLIEVEHITKTYAMGMEGVAALHDISFRIERGELTAIMGPSGSGKTTLMNILGCLDVPTSGIYLLDGVPVQGMTDSQLAEIRSRKIGFVFQTYNLLPRLTALANVELPLLYHRAREPRRRASEALAAVGLADRARHRPSELSGGQQQRVGIARALVNEPLLLLADEPTGNLDTQTSVEIMAMLQRLNRDRGLTVVIVTHEPEIADYTRRIVSIRDGLIVNDEQVASPKEAFSVDGVKELQA